MPENDFILGDIRVLDLSEDVAGPFCTKLLAGLGAEVIKVEPPGTGDVTRRTGPFVHETPHAEQSAAFLYLNTGKKSITLDIQSPTGRCLVQRLAQPFSEMLRGRSHANPFGQTVQPDDAPECIVLGRPSLLVANETFDLGPRSNGEYLPHRRTPVVDEAVRRLLAHADAHAPRLGMSRRHFLQSLCGAASMLA